MTHEEFMKIVRDSNARWESYKETEAGRLFLRINSTEMSDEECLQLEQDIREFYESDPSEEDMELLQGYPEMIHMVCNGIREKRAGEGE